MMLASIISLAEKRSPRTYQTKPEELYKISQDMLVRYLELNPDDKLKERFPDLILGTLSVETDHEQWTDLEAVL
jgi:hypothetical protein